MNSKRRSRSPAHGAFGMESSPSAQLLGSKRQRPVEDDEIVLDNYHSHKRYLTEVMASSLNSLKVADPGGRSGPASGMGAAAVHMEFGGSPAPTETPSGSARSVSPFPSHGDDVMSTLDSAMSDDSEDSVGWRAANGPDGGHAGHGQHAPGGRRGHSGSSPPSPDSPRGGRPGAPAGHPSAKQGGLFGWGTSPSPRGVPGPNPWGLQSPKAGTTSWSGQGPAGASWQQQARPASIPTHRSLTSPRHLADAMEGRLPPSPSDPNQSANLRRAALLRALQMRTHPSPSTSAAGEPEPLLGGTGTPAGPDPGSASSPPGSPPKTSGLHPSMLGLTTYTPEYHKGRSADYRSPTTSSAQSSMSPTAVPPQREAHRQNPSTPLPASSLGRAQPGHSCELAGKGKQGQRFPDLSSHEDKWRSEDGQGSPAAIQMQTSSGSDQGTPLRSSPPPPDALTPPSSMEQAPLSYTPPAKALGSWRAAKWQRGQELGRCVVAEPSASSVAGFGGESPSVLRGEVDSAEAAAWRAWSVTAPAVGSSGPDASMSGSQSSKRPGRWRSGHPQNEVAAPAKRGPPTHKVAKGGRRQDVRPRPYPPHQPSPNPSSHPPATFTFPTLRHTGDGERGMGQDRPASPCQSLSESGENL